MTVNFKPYLIKARHFHLTWRDIVRRSTQSGEPGFCHYLSPIAEVLVYRDADRKLRGVLVVYNQFAQPPASKGELLFYVDPSYRRRGVGIGLLRQAARQNMVIDFERQKYSREGWACISKFLEGAGQVSG
jgi:GNAT superfamily N-acetyltransferase